MKPWGRQFSCRLPAKVTVLLKIVAAKAFVVVVGVTVTETVVVATEKKNRFERWIEASSGEGSSREEATSIPLEVLGKAN